MKQLFVVAFLLFLCSCGHSVTKEDLTFLDGYWEIKKVNFPNGDTMTYEMNSTIDYIELTGSKGYRKKVQPLVDGSFITSDDAEYFSIADREGTFIMTYESTMDTWEEEIISITKTTLALRNEDQITYFYERYEPIILE